MTIKTQLVVLLASMAVVITTTLGGVLYADYTIDHALKENGKAYDIVTRVYALNRLVTELTPSGINRIEQQWGTLSNTLRTKLHQQESSSPEVTFMLADLDQFDSVFAALLALHRKDHSGDFSTARRYRRNHISILLHDLATRADAVATRNLEEVRNVQQTRDFFLISISTIWCSAALFWVVTLWSGIMSPLRKMLNAIQIVGHGGMDHRIPPSKKNNEINALSKSFNAMLDRLQDLTVSRNKVLIATDEERNRIGRDLHDGICQMMTGIRLQMETLAYHNGNNETIAEIIKNLRQAQNETQRIVRNLHPAMLDEMGLIATIKWFMGHQKDHITLSLNIDIEEHDIPKHLHTPIFRIIQEASSNAIRHGRAESMHIQITRENGELDIFIEDDGRGFSLSAPVFGNGLVNIRERVEANLGELTIDTKPGRGCSIIAAFPVDKSRPL